jgi:tetratricopeptide (TPR) repeat protein
MGLLKRLFGIGPATAEEHYQRGFALEAQGEHDQAIAEHTEAIRLYAKHANAFWNRGMAHLGKHDYDKAIADFTELIRLQPNNSTAYSNRAYALQNVGNYAQAIADYSEAIRLSPDQPAWLHNRAMAWIELRQYDRAIADFSEFLKLHPDAGVYDNRGNAYRDIGNFEQAVADFLEAIRLKPNDPAAYFNLADLRSTCPQAEFRNGKEAIAYIQRACDLMKVQTLPYSIPQSFVLVRLAAAHAEIGEFKQAVELQRKALESSDVPFFALENLRERLKRYEEGKPWRQE